MPSILLKRFSSLAHLGGNDYKSREGQYIVWLGTLEALTNFLSLHHTVGNGTAKTLTGLFFISVIASTIEETVPRFQRVVYSLNIVYVL